MRILEPSLLSFDLKQIDKQLIEVKKAGAEFIHYDVMDGKFVPNTTFGVEWLAKIQQHGLKANVHMMVREPAIWINNFIKHPMNVCLFHPEVYEDNTKILELFTLLHKHNVKCGLAIKAHIDINKYSDLVNVSDYVCIMSVEPGKGGQSFMIESISNLKKAKKIKETDNPNLIIQLDGGVNFDVMKQTYQWVDHFISGSFLMKQENKSAIFEFALSLD